MSTKPINLKALFISLLLLLSIADIVAAPPCFRKRKPKDVTEMEDAKLISLQHWMFTPVEWETNERIYLRAWMYVVPQYNQPNGYDLREWMIDLSQGWAIHMMPDSEPQGALIIFQLDGVFAGHAEAPFFYDEKPMATNRASVALQPWKLRFF